MVNTIPQFSITRLPAIYFGAGSIGQLSGLLSHADGTILLVTGNKSFDNNSVSTEILSILNSKKLKYYRYIIGGEPSPADIDLAINTFKADTISTVLAIGGGSVMDAGKAIAAMFCEEGSVTEYLEGVGTKKPTGKRLKLITIPTTSGTGSEATKNAVISEFGPMGFKKSLRHDNYVPDVAIIDPKLIVNCPPEITAASGMDAFTQLIESYVSTKSNPITDALALSGMEKIAKSLKTAFLNGADLNARSDMAYAALMSGITLANAGLGLVHGFAQPLGSLFPIPHGIVCGIMMIAVNQYTIIKLQSNNGFGAVLEKYANIGRLFSDDKNESQEYYIDSLLHTIDIYAQLFKMPKLSAFGVTPNDFQNISSRTELKNHPIQIDQNEIEKILTDSLY